MVIPEAVERGSTVEMRCQYDLEQEVLYSVKWYRGDREFCRYSPRDVPPLKIFPIPGIEVNVSVFTYSSSDEPIGTVQSSAPPSRPVVAKSSTLGGSLPNIFVWRSM
ncbi:hypothetical protein CASFOL_043088 [Castilleja foliolosa]|uniref:Ig-like domain-containing protein n=1 Tax=Castilleja foliolosa TaxID=1961234 RepID=A0ABD3B6R9_9LAMI